MGLWTSDISTTVYNRVVNEFFKNSLTRYGMTAYKVGNYIVCTNFSTSQISETAPKFPYVSCIELSGQERGQTLEGNSLNAALFTFQWDVIHNSANKETDVKKIMAEITEIMKTMLFQVTAMPSFDSKPQEYRMVARFSRVISQYDVI